MLIAEIEMNFVPVICRQTLSFLSKYIRKIYRHSKCVVPPTCCLHFCIIYPVTPLVRMYLRCTAAWYPSQIAIVFFLLDKVDLVDKGSDGWA
jgi:hypothetical protein